jgi:hypothetical protein
MRIKDHILLNCFLTKVKNTFYYLYKQYKQYIQLYYIMSRFLKLTQLIINTSKIGTIEKKQNKYYVNLLDGSILSGFSLFGSGTSKDNR